MIQKKSAREGLEHWSTVELDSAEAARRASVLILDFEAHPEKYTDSEDITSPFHQILGLFQQPTVEEAAVTLRAEALPALLRLYDARLREWRKAGPREGYDSAASDLLFALKIFAMYRGEEPLQRIIDAARIPLDSDGYMWSVVLSALVEAEPEAATRRRGDCRPASRGHLRPALRLGAPARGRQARTEGADGPGRPEASRVSGALREWLALEWVIARVRCTQ